MNVDRRVLIVRLNLPGGRLLFATCSEDGPLDDVEVRLEEPTHPQLGRGADGAVVPGEVLVQPLAQKRSPTCDPLG